MHSPDRKAVCVVDDDEGVRDYLTHVIRREGYECTSFENALGLLSHLQDQDYDPGLVLSDIGMPGVSGLDLLRTLRALAPETPVILISGMYELSLAVQAIKAGASDYLLKPARPEDVARLLDKHLGKNDARRKDELRQAIGKLSEQGGGTRASGAVLQGIFNALGFKRYETLQHSQRVAGYSRLFGQDLGFTEARLARLERGALLHDIGKIAIPHNVLMKRGPLSPEEWRVMKLHPVIGWELLNEFDGFERESEIVLGHHEKFDGSGYPRGLMGESIPLEARLFSIVDAYDAMTSDRPYRAGRRPDEAMAEIRASAGGHFDPDLTTVFTSLPRGALDAIRTRWPDMPEELPE